MEDRLLSLFDDGGPFSTFEIWKRLDDPSLDGRLVFQVLFALTQGVRPKLHRSNCLWGKLVYPPEGDHINWIALTTRSIVEDETVKELGLAFATMDVVTDPEVMVYDWHNDAIAKAGSIHPVYFLMSHNEMYCVGMKDVHPGDGYTVRLLAQNPVQYYCTPKNR